MWKWDKVHIGIQLIVLFVVIGQSWTKFTQTFGFCDLIVLFAKYRLDLPMLYI